MKTVRGRCKSGRGRSARTALLVLAASVALSVTGPGCVGRAGGASGHAPAQAVVAWRAGGWFTVWLDASGDTVAVVVSDGRGGNQRVAALDSRTGKTKWVSPLPGRTTVGVPMVAGKRVVAAFYFDAQFRWYIAAFEAATGRLLWRRPSPTPVVPVQNFSSVITDDRMVGVGGEGEVWSLDLQQGRLQWQNRLPGRVRGPGIVLRGGSMQVFWARSEPDARNGLDCISLTDGKLIGRWEDKPGLWPAQLLFAADGRVGVVADRPRAGRQVLNEAPCHVTCLAGERPQPLWTGTYPAADALVLVGGTLYGLDADVGGKHMEHAVWAADAMTGRLKGVRRAGPAFALSADSPAAPLLLGSVLVLPLAAESPHTPPRLVWLDLATGSLLQSYVGARGSPAKALRATATVLCTSRSDGATLALAYSGHGQLPTSRRSPPS